LNEGLELGLTLLLIGSSFIVALILRFGLSFGGSGGESRESGSRTESGSRPKDKLQIIIRISTSIIWGDVVTVVDATYRRNLGNARGVDPMVTVLEAFV